jgi:RNase P protein component
MLPKKRRLTAAEVREVMATGKGVRSGVVSLKYVVKHGLFRAAVVAPKSTAPKATVRNRLRRAVYQILATLPPGEKKMLENTMGVFFVRSIPTPLTPVLRSDISGIVKKL